MSIVSTILAFVGPMVAFMPREKAMPAIKYEPFSIDGVIAWLETKNPAGEYNFTSWDRGCLWARYTLENGGKIDRHRNFYAMGGQTLGVSPKDHMRSDAWQWEIAAVHPETYGAALLRARAYKASHP